MNNKIPHEGNPIKSKPARLCFAIIPMSLAGSIVGLFFALFKHVQRSMFGFRPEKPHEPDYKLVFFGWLAGVALGFCLYQVIGRFRFFTVSLGWLLGLLCGLFILVVFGDGLFSAVGPVGIMLPFFTCLFGGGGIGVICAIKKQAANRYGYRTLLFGIIASLVVCEVICWRIVNPHF